MNRLDQEGTGQSLPHFHVPVLPRETIGDLHVQPGGRYVDCTLGSGGHALAILEASAPGGQLLGIDADPRAIAESRDRLSAYRKDILLVNDNFSNLKDICNRNNFYPVNGILFDLGLSSRQLEAEDRGFSFQHESPLDMRFDPAQERTAADIVNNYSETELADLIYQHGEDPHSRQIAHHIVASRPMRTTSNWPGSGPGNRPRQGKDTPRHQDFPGPAHRGEPGIAQLAAGPATSHRPAGIPRALGSHQLSFPGRPHRQEHPQTGVDRLHLPARRTDVHLRPQPSTNAGPQKSGKALCDRGAIEPAQPERPAASG